MVRSIYVDGLALLSEVSATTLRDKCCFVLSPSFSTILCSITIIIINLNNSTSWIMHYYTRKVLRHVTGIDQRHEAVQVFYWQSFESRLSNQRLLIFKLGSHQTKSDSQPACNMNLNWGSLINGTDHNSPRFSRTVSRKTPPHSLHFEITQLQSKLYAHVHLFSLTYFRDQRRSKFNL